MRQCLVSGPFENIPLNAKLRHTYSIYVETHICTYIYSHLFMYTYIHIFVNLFIWSLSEDLLLALFQDEASAIREGWKTTRAERDEAIEESQRIRGKMQDLKREVESHVLVFKSTTRHPKLIHSRTVFPSNFSHAFFRWQQGRPCPWNEKSWPVEHITSPRTNASVYSWGLANNTFPFFQPPHLVIN